MYIIYDLGRYTCTGTEDFFYKYQTLVLNFTQTFF